MKIGEHQLEITGRLVKTARLSAETYEFVDDPGPILELLRRNGDRVDLFTFMQRVPDTVPKYPYFLEWDNLAVLPVSTFDDWWLNQIGFKARNKAKQADKKGVRIEEVPFSDELVRGIWAIYNEAPMRQGKRYPHFGKDLLTVRRMTDTFLDRSAFIGAFLDDALIGFVKLHCDRSRTQAGLTHILSLLAHRDKSPTNALLREAVRYCAREKIPYLVYSRFADGRKKSDSLMDFKERNGFKRVELPRYFVPLTAIGAAALRLHLHRRPIDYVPENVLSALRSLRKSWYHSRYPTAGD